MELPLRTFFEQPKVADLALRVEEAVRSGVGPAAARRSAAGAARAGTCHCRFAQQRLWFIDQLEGGSLYNLPIALRMSGKPLSVAVLSAALAEVVRPPRGSAARYFPRRGPRQVILPAGTAGALPLVDLSGLQSPSDRSDPSDLKARQERGSPGRRGRAGRSISSAAALLRCLVLRLADGEHTDRC